MVFARMVSERGDKDVTFVVLSTWVDRLRGLLGTRADADPVMLTRCGSIHTFGMRYSIDVAFVDEHGGVLRSARALVPRRLLSSPHAFCVFERPASEMPWFEEGDFAGVAAIVVPESDCMCEGSGGVL